MYAPQEESINNNSDSDSNYEDEDELTRIFPPEGTESVFIKINLFMTNFFQWRMQKHV